MVLPPEPFELLFKTSDTLCVMRVSYSRSLMHWLGMMYWRLVSQAMYFLSKAVKFCTVVVSVPGINRRGNSSPQLMDLSHEVLNFAKLHAFAHVEYFALLN